MMTEEKSTHAEMLFQFWALWLKGMTLETVQSSKLMLNDFIALGEETISRKGRNPLNGIFCFEQYLSRLDCTPPDATAADRGLDAGLVSGRQHP